MSQEFTTPDPEIENLEKICLKAGIPLLEGLLVAFGIPEPMLDSEQLKPIKHLHGLLVSECGLSSAEAATLITKSFDGLLGTDPGSVVELKDGENP